MKLLYYAPTPAAVDFLEQTLCQDGFTLNIESCSRNLIQDYLKYIWTKGNVLEWEGVFCLCFLYMSLFHYVEKMPFKT